MSASGRWATCVVLLIGGLVPVAGPAAPVCAADGPRAALVVDTGEGVHRFCVALPDDEVNGLELIALAGEQHGLSYRFGHGGGAVCMLAGVGATSDDCFERYPDFWGYWRGSSGGGWTWSSTGAGNTSVGDGDVEGWSWGSGNDGNTHPRPPDTSFSSVCPASAPSKTRRPPAEKEPRERSAGPPPTGSPAPAPDPVARAPRVQGPAPDAVERAPKRLRKQREERERKRSGRGRTAAVRSEPTAAGDLLPAQKLGAEKEERSAPPPAGVAALGAAALLGGAGLVFSRRRRGRS